MAQSIPCDLTGERSRKKWACTMGNAQILKPMEMIKNSLQENAKIIITKNRMSPTLLLGSLPVNVTTEGKSELTFSKSKN